MSRPLIIDDALKREVENVVHFARQNHYIPGETIVPGDDPNYILQAKFGYRCVFSFTRTPSGLFRDLSISVDEEGKYPNPYAAYTIAELFGFIGWDHETIDPPPDGWMIDKDIHFNAIRIVEPIPQKSAH